MVEDKMKFLPYKFEELPLQAIVAAEREWGIVIAKKRDFEKLSFLQKELVFHEADKCQ